MKNKPMASAIAGILFTMFILIPFLRWSGVPTFDHLLTALLGEPTILKGTIVIVLLIILLILFFRSIRRVDAKK